MDLQVSDEKMMPRTIASILVFVLLVLVYSAPAMAGDRFFVGVGGGPFHSRGSGFFIDRHRSGADFFFHFGHRPFGLVPWAPGPWGYNYPPPVTVPYPVVPQQNYDQGFSGTDSTGALYVDGYRVLPSGWLRVQVDPSDATVLIDGFPTSVDRTHGSSASRGLPVGSHVVEVYKTGFQTYQSEVEVNRARETSLRVKLDP